MRLSFLSSISFLSFSIFNSLNTFQSQTIILSTWTSSETRNTRKNVNFISFSTFLIQHILGGQSQPRPPTERRWRFVVLRCRRKSFDVSRPVLPDWTIFWKLLATNFLTKVVQMFVDLWAFLKTSLLRKNYCLGNIWKVWATFLFQHLVSLTCYRSFGLMSYLMLVDRSDWWWTWHCHFQELKGSKITNLWWKFYQVKFVLICL